jgi:hypothetical protein
MISSQECALILPVSYNEKKMENPKIRKINLSQELPCILAKH